MTKIQQKDEMHSLYENSCTQVISCKDKLN